MEEQWPGQPVAANDSGAWPGQPEQQQEQPSTRGRLQPLINQLTPEEPERQTPQQIQQKGYEDFDFWNNTVRTFMAGTKGVEEAVKASEDPNRPWYERGMAQADILYSEFTGAVSTLTGPAFQAVGGALEKLTRGYTGSSEEWQAALIIPGMFGGAKYAELKTPPPSFKPAPIRPIEGSPNPGLLRSAGARTGVPEVDAVLDHPVIHGVLDNAVIDDTHEIPNSWGGSVPLENPVTYRDKDFPKTLTVPRSGSLPPVQSGFVRFYHGGENPTAGGPRWVTTDPEYARNFRASPDHPNEVHYVDIPKGDPTEVAARAWDQMDEQAGTNMVGRYNHIEVPEKWAQQMQPVSGGTVTFDTAEPAIIHENVEEFVIDQLMKGGMDRDASLRAAYWGWGNPAEHAWYRAHGMDPEHVEAALAPYLDKIASRKPNPDNIPSDLFRETYPDGNPLKDTAGEVGKPTPEEAARAQKIIQDNTGPRITGGTADKPDLRVAKDLGIIGPERPSINEGTPEEAARNAIQPITAFHGSPYSFDAFDMGKIGTGEGAQAYGHGLYFAENPKVAEDYAGRVVGQPGGYNNEGGHQYQVRIHADREHFLDWDKPLSEQPNIPKEIVDRVSELTDQDPRGMTGADVVHALSRQADQMAASEQLRQAGIPGIKYLDQGSRAPEQLQEGLERLQKSAADTRDLLKGATGEHAKALQKTLADEEAAIKAQTDKIKNYKETRNYVVFDHNDVEITHRNGEPVKPAMPPQQPPGKTPADEAYQQRFKEWVGKIKEPGDIDSIIARVAEANNYFPDARAGQISEAHLDVLAKSAGWEPSKFDPAALRSRFQSDAEIRAVEQVLLQTRDDYHEALTRVREESTHENLEAAMDAQVRLEAALEYVGAFRADWGRAGGAQQEFLRREARREQYTARSASGVPKDANDLIAAIEEFSHAVTRESLDRFIAAADKAIESKEPLPSGVSDLIGSAKAALDNLCGAV